MSESGPKFEVPRIVWLIVFGTLVIVAAAPLLITLDQIPNSWSESLVQEISRGLVCLAYGAAVFSGLSRFMNWLFGPYFNERPVENPPA